MSKAEKLITKSMEGLKIQDDLKSKYLLQIDNKIHSMEWTDYTISLKHIRKLVMRNPGTLAKMQRIKKVVIGTKYVFESYELMELPAYFQDEKLNELLKLAELANTKI